MYNKCSFCVSMFTLIAHPHMVLGKITELQNNRIVETVINKIMIHHEKWVVNNVYLIAILYETITWTNVIRLLKLFNNISIQVYGNASFTLCYKILFFYLI